MNGSEHDRLDTLEAKKLDKAVVEASEATSAVSSAAISASSSAGACLQEPGEHFHEEG